MFILIAAVILIISFLIALVSLVREQKKLNKIASLETKKDEEQASAPLLEPIEQPSASPKVEGPEIKTEFNVVEPPKPEPELVPFPWEQPTNTNANETTEVLGPQSATKEPPENTFILHPRRTNVGFKSNDLNGSVTLKDLADKK